MPRWQAVESGTTRGGSEGYERRPISRRAEPNARRGRDRGKAHPAPDGAADRGACAQQHRLLERVGRRPLERRVLPLAARVVEHQGLSLLRVVIQMSWPPAPPKRDD